MTTYKISAPTSTPNRGNTGIIVAEASVMSGPQECQFISPVPIRLVVDGKPVQRGNSLYDGNYLTRITIPFPADGREVEVGVRANGWKQSTALFLKGCSPEVVLTNLKPDFGFEECRPASGYRHSSGSENAQIGWQDDDVKVGDTLMVMLAAKTPREVDVPFTTDGAWTTKKSLFARNAEWPRLSFPIHQLSDAYTFSIPEEYYKNIRLYRCRGEFSKTSAAPVSHYPAVAPQLCRPKPGQSCVPVVWVFPDGPKKPTGFIQGGKPPENYKKCFGVFDPFGRKIATCSLGKVAEDGALSIYYESVRFPNGSFWDPSRPRGDHLLFEK